MSRRPREYVWYQYFDVKEWALCPVCSKNMMDRENSDSWHAEHILKLSLGGPDIYPNLIPICRSCNLAMRKDCRSTYHYMSIIGKISNEEAVTLEKQQMSICASCDLVCEQIQKNGKRCANLKGGKNELYCWKHIRDEMEAMDCSP